MPGDKKKIKNPGARGGKYYINDKGEVIYGEKPTGKKGKVVDEKGGEHNRNVYDSKKTFKDQFPSFEEFNRRAKEKGLAELDAKAYKQIYQREHKEYMKHVGEAGTKGQKGIDEKTRKYLDANINFDENGFHSISYDEANKGHKLRFDKELSKEEYMKFYKEQKYKHKKFTDEQKKKAEAEKPKEVKRFDKNGNMTTELKPLNSGTYPDADEVRTKILADAMDTYNAMKKYPRFTEEHMDFYRNHVEELFNNDDAKFWHDHSDMSSWAVLSDQIENTYNQKSKVDEKAKEALYKWYEMDNIGWEFSDWREKGLDKVDDKKKESIQKKAKRDAEHSKLNEVDQKRNEIYKNHQEDSYEFFNGIRKNIDKMGLDKEILDMFGGMPGITDDQWMSLEHQLGFKILEGEKQAFYNNVIKTSMEANELDKKINQPDYKIPTWYSDDATETLNKFYESRIDANGKTYDTPMEKDLYETRRRLDDELDNAVDYTPVLEAMHYIKNDLPSSYISGLQEVVNKSSSPSEFVNNLHEKHKELNAYMDKYRDWTDLDTPITSIEPEEEIKFQKATKEMYAINKMKERLSEYLLDNKSARQHLEETKYVSDEAIEYSGKKIMSLTSKFAENENMNGGMFDVLSFYKSNMKDSLVLNRTLSRISFDNDAERAYASGNELHTNFDKVNTSTLIHEMGHILEYNSIEYSDLARNFFNTRTDGTRKYKLANIYKGVNYDMDEEAHVDSFFHSYIGKDYYPDKDRMAYNTHADEVLSMGFQYMHDNPAKLYVQDPEHYALIKRIFNGG